MPKALDLTGQTFNFLTAIEKVPSKKEKLIGYVGVIDAEI